MSKPGASAFHKTGARSALLVLAAILALWLADHQATRYFHRLALESHADRLHGQVRQRSQRLSDRIEGWRGDVRFLSHAPPVPGIARALTNDGFDALEQTPLALWVRRLQEIFAAYAEARPDLLQIRLIGIADGGRELVRVDRIEGRVVVVPDAELQAKGTRDYFLATLQLAVDETFVSNLDLNREHGQVVVPHVPTIRATTPVFVGGRMTGMIVINADGAFALGDAAANLPSEQIVYVTNADGDYLLHPDPSMTFGFDLGSRHRWQDDHVPAAASVDENATALSTYSTPDGLVHATWADIPLGRDGRFLRLIQLVRDVTITAEVRRSRLQVLAGLVLASLIMGVPSYLGWLARRRRDQITAQQARLAAIVVSSTDAIIGKTLDGTVTDWNPAAERLFGYTADDAVGRRLSELIFPPGAEAEEGRILQHVARGQRVNHFETRRRHRDGHLIDVSMTAAPVFDAGGTVTGVSTVIRDITEQHAAQAALDAAQQRLLHTTHANGIGLWEWNLQTNELIWDDTMFVLYGRSRAEFSGAVEAWRECLHADDAERAEQETRAAIDGNGVLDMGFRILTSTGEVRHIRARAIVERDAHGKPLRMLGTNFDVTRLKVQEEQIREGEARWRQLANSMPQLVWTCRGDGPCDFLSEQWVRYTGIPEADQLGFGWLDQVHPDDRPLLTERWQAAVDTRGVFNVEFRIRRHDGVYRWFDTRAVPLLDPDTGNVVRWFGSNTDIEARKQAEQALKELNATLEEQVARRTRELHEVLALQGAILSEAGFAVIATEVDGTIKLFNPAAERLLGYRAEEVVGKVTPAIIHEPAEMAERAQALSRELGHPVEVGFETFVAKARLGIIDANEWTYVRKDGTRVPVWLSVSALRRDNGELFGFLGMVVDLGERRQQEKALRDSERFIKNITDNIPGMVGYWDAQLRCRFANNAYLTWFGKTAEQMAGISIHDLLGPELFRRNEPHITAALRGEAQHFERTLTRADGSIGYTWAHYIPDFDEHKVRGFFVLVSDITDLKQAQLALESANRDLQVRTREAEAASVAKSQFLANISHEIRSPMNAIIGMLQLLLDTELAMRQRDYATKALSATRSLLHLLNDILDFSKVEAGKIEVESLPFSLDAVLSEISGIVSSILDAKPVELIYSIGAPLPPSLVGDAFRLRQVLLNLIGNAIKFTSRGEVVVTIAPFVVDDGHVEIEFSVRDTGIGIAPEKLSLIFEGFSQAEASTTRRFGGTGLGLAISRRLVELMGGKLCVESAPGVGSRFHFRLRFQTDVADAQDTGGSAMPASPRRRLKVLIVDDHQNSLDALHGMVASLGWPAERAASGEEALTLLSRQSSAHFDLVLIDATLPGLSGWETAKRLRQQGLIDPTAVILMLAAHEHAGLKTAMQYEPGVARGILVKPLTPSMLFDALVQEAPESLTSHPSRGPQRKAHRLAGLRLLVVEDNAMNQQVALGLLGNEGAAVELASNGAEGVERVLAADPPFNAVLMDIQMPVMDGFEATRRIRRNPRASSLPIIAMTANALASDRAACLDAGMNDHIAKPIELDGMVATILRHCRPDAITVGGSGLTRGRDDTDADIDLETALSRIGGNRSLLLNLARRFVDDAPAMLAELRDLPLDSTSERARELLHTLKGTAGTVGAMRLFERCGRLEKQLRSGSPADPQAATELSELLAAALRDLSQALPEIAAPRPEAGGDEVLNRAAITVLLAKLDVQLEGANMRAVEIFGELDRRFGKSLGNLIVPLSEAMRRLDFRRARRELAQLRDALPP